MYWALIYTGFEHTYTNLYKEILVLCFSLHPRTSASITHFICTFIYIFYSETSYPRKKYQVFFISICFLSYLLSFSSVFLFLSSSCFFFHLFSSFTTLFPPLLLLALPCDHRSYFLLHLLHPLLVHDHTSSTTPPPAPPPSQTQPPTMPEEPQTCRTDR